MYSGLQNGFFQNLLITEFFNCHNDIHSNLHSQISSVVVLYDHDGTSALIYREGRSVPKKKPWPFIPCRLPPPPLVVAGGTDIGTILAFVGGWFEFKLGYLNLFIVLGCPESSERFLEK
jgi:hypothetical protein